MLVPVILAGGHGTRLWPLSRMQYPKQFLNLLGGESLLQSTLQRVEQLNLESPVTIVCNEEHRFLIAEQARLSGVENCSIILEPHSRNTAAAIALSALSALTTGEDPVLLVLPSDHIVSDLDAFTKIVTEGQKCAEQGLMVTFGVQPTRPETGFGYIKVSEKEVQGGCFQVDRFVEKPSLQHAERFLSTNKYLWNSGMFIFKASTYLSQLKKFEPNIFRYCELAFKARTRDLDFTRIDPSEFSKCSSLSIDVAVMEKTDLATVIPFHGSWNDVGSWLSVWESSEKDKNGNVLNGDIVSSDSNGCYIYGEDRLIATIGLQNLTVVDTKDALLVADKSKVQNVKDLAEYLNSTKRNESKRHQVVYRPWGKYETIAVGESYVVKTISIYPNGKLSTQFHNHRAEHWVVVSGIAKVTKGDKEFELLPDQSTFISPGEIHSIENCQTDVLKIVEIQTGDEIDEEDIVRLDDRYGRC